MVDALEREKPQDLISKLKRFEVAHWRRRLDPSHVILLIAGLLVAYLALVPIGTMMVASFRSAFLSSGPSYWTFMNYVDAFTSPGSGELVSNTAIYAVASAAIATVCGFGLAWLVIRTNTPGKKLAYATAIFPLMVPGVLSTVAWVLLLDPDTGAANMLLKDVGLPAFNVYSLPGMIFVECLSLMPLAFLMGMAAFSAMDSSLEDAAMSCGAPRRRVFFSITLPLALPAITSAALIMFVLAISVFEVPQLIGVPAGQYVFVSKIYDALKTFPPNYGEVGVIGMVVLAVATIGLVMSQRVARKSRAQTVTGKGFRTTRTDIGRWKWAGLAAFIIAFGVVVVMPLAILVWSSLLPGYQRPSLQALQHITLANYRSIGSTPDLVGSIKNSILTSVIAATVVTVLGTIVAYICVKTRARGRAFLDFLATVPIAVPGIIMGIGILFWYLAVPLPFHLYGTLTIMIIAFVTAGLPFGLRYLTPGFNQLHDELEEAATVSGARWGTILRRIFMPLLVPSMVASFLYVLMLTFRDVSSSIILYSPKTQVLSITLYNLWTTGSSYPTVAALGVLIVLALVVLLGLVWLFGKRVGSIAFSVVSRRDEK